MNWLIQDVIVLVFALGAVGILVRRVVGLFRPAAGHRACGACPSCPSARKAASPARVPRSQSSANGG